MNNGYTHLKPKSADDFAKLFIDKSNKRLLMDWYVAHYPSDLVIYHELVRRKASEELNKIKKYGWYEFRIKNRMEDERL